MAKLGKVLAVILVVLGVLLLSVYFLANRYLTPERIKALVISPLEEATGLKVQIGQISRRGFLGVKVDKVHFLEPSSGKEVLSAEELRLSLSLSPLLKGELLITEAALVSPEIYLVRLKDGTINLQKFFQEKPSGKPQKEAKPSRLAFVFQQIRIEKAKIHFRDEKEEFPPALVLLNLAARLKLAGKELGLEGEGNLGLSVAEFPVIEDLRFQVQTQAKTILAKILGGNILAGDPSGEIAFKEKALKGTLSLQGVSLEKTDALAERLRPYFFPKAELPEISGKMDLKLSLEGSLEAPRYEALVFLKPLRTRLEEIDFLAEGEIKANPQALKPDLSLKINGQPLMLKGKVLISGKLPQVDLKLTTSKFDLTSIIPEENPQETKGKETVKSSPPKEVVIAAQGKIEFFGQEVCYKICGQEVRAVLFLSPQEISLKEMTLLLAGAVTQLSGKISGLPKGPHILFSYSVAGADLPLLAENFWSESNYFSSGKVWSEGTFRGQGLEAETLKKTLSGKGQARFLNLGLKETPVSTVVANLLGMEELKKLSFEKGQAVFEIKEGLVDIKGKFSREGLEILMLGQMGLDGRLNLKPRFLFTGKMAEAFKRRFPGASLFRTQKGYEVPLAITGTFEEPKVALAQEVKEKVKEKAVEKIFKFLGR